MDARTTLRAGARRAADGWMDGSRARPRQGRGTQRGLGGGRPRASWHSWARAIPTTHPAFCSRQQSRDADRPAGAVRGDRRGGGSAWRVALPPVSHIYQRLSLAFLLAFPFVQGHISTTLSAAVHIPCRRPPPPPPARPCLPAFPSTLAARSTCSSRSSSKQE